MSVSMIRMDIDDNWGTSAAIPGAGGLTLQQSVGALVYGWTVNGGHVVTVVEEIFKGLTGLKLTVMPKGGGPSSVWFLTGQEVA